MRLKRWERPEVEGGAPTGEWRRAGRASRPRSNAGEDRRVRRRAPRRRVEREVWQQQQLEAQQERQWQWQQREKQQREKPAAGAAHSVTQARSVESVVERLVARVQREVWQQQQLEAQQEWQRQRQQREKQLREKQARQQARQQLPIRRPPSAVGMGASL